MNELLPDFEKTALAVTQKVPANLQITNEVVSGDKAVVMMKILDADEKEELQQATLIKTPGGWILGDAESQAMVKKAGKKFFFNCPHRCSPQRGQGHADQNHTCSSGS